MTTSNRSRVEGLGWRPNLPDWRDAKFRFSGSAAQEVKPAAAPPSADLFLGLSNPVADQGITGSCVGQSMKNAVDILRQYDADRYSTQYSALHAYWHARAMSQDGSETIDAGAYIRDGAKALQKIGIAPENRWPWNPAKVNAKPSASADKEAARWKLGVYYNIPVIGGPDPVEAIMSAVASKHPVVLGFVCHGSMFTPEVDRSGLIPMPVPGDSFEGGHAVCIGGYDRGARVFTFENSWGVGWGNHGFGRLPFDYIRYDLVGDITVLTGEA